MKICKEMIKLRKLLTARGISWQDASVIYPEEKIEMLYKTVGAKLSSERQYFDLTIYRTHFDVNGTHYSVIMALALMADLNRMRIRIMVCLNVW